jgi:hypothetical protein
MLYRKIRMSDDLRGNGFTASALYDYRCFAPSEWTISGHAG